MDTKKIIMGVSIAIAVAINACAYFIFGPKIVVMLYSFIISLAVGVLPYFIYEYKRMKDVKEMEAFFPTFLRDLSEITGAGVSMPKALKSAAKNNYGALTKEVEKMGVMLSWGIPFPRVLMSFYNRVKESSYMRRGVSILAEAFSAGGDLSGTMDSIAKSTIKLQEVDADKVSILQEQTMIMYLIHVLFVGIVVALYKILIPLLSIPSGPGISSFMQVGEAPKMQYYKILFLVTLAVQSFCNAFVAGEASEGRLVSGFKHAIVMLTIALAVYAVFILPTPFNISITLSKDVVSTGEQVLVTGIALLEETPADNADITVVFANTTKASVANEKGEFEVAMYAPKTRGTFDITVIAEKDDYKKQESVQIVVT